MAEHVSDGQSAGTGQVKIAKSDDEGERVGRTIGGVMLTSYPHFVHRRLPLPPPPPFPCPYLLN